MIYGIGTDLVEIKRIKESLSDRFVNKILTVSEIEIYNSLRHEKRKIEFIAGRFAAKEAVSKAHGTGMDGIGFRDIEVLKDNGKPICTFKDFNVQISISHTDDYAVAFVILEK
ncbi:holo-ACP synthase [Mycoplasmatota bacterium WC44]